jgi:hypothetical protein
MLRARPGWRRIRPPRSRVNTICEPKVGNAGKLDDARRLVTDVVTDTDAAAQPLWSHFVRRHDAPKPQSL